MVASAGNGAHMSGVAPAPDRRRARAPRLAARCPAVVSFGAGRWEGETEDLGTSGCRIVAHFALRRGEVVSLLLRFPAVPFELKVTGTVAWGSTTPPYRTGVAFAKGQEGDARRFVRAVQATHPAIRPSPTRGAPSPGGPDLTAAERELLDRPAEGTRPTLWRSDAPGPRSLSWAPGCGSTALIAKCAGSAGGRGPHSS